MRLVHHTSLNHFAVNGTVCILARENTVILSSLLASVCHTWNVEMIYK